MRACFLSRWRCVTVAILLSIVCLCVGSCAPAAVTPDTAFSYADGDFSATVSGTVTRLVPDGYTGSAALVGERLTDTARSFSAAVAVYGDASGGRAATVTYTAPSALAGVTVTRITDPSTGRSTVTLVRPVEGGGSVTIDLSSAAASVTDSLLAPVLALLPVGDVTAVTPTEGGRMAVTRTDADGEAVFTFDEGHSLPTEAVRTTPARQVEVRVGGD